MANGVANANAHGQATISSATEFAIACEGFVVHQIPSVSSARLKVVLPDDSTKYRVTLRANPATDISEVLPVALVMDRSQRSLEFQALPNPGYEKLKQLVVKKNELYFHRWRPQNITYLYGFRKHEQGNNASEIALFDPIVAELESQIAAARKPVWQKLKIQLTD